MHCPMNIIHLGGNSTCPNHPSPLSLATPLLDLNLYRSDTFFFYCRVADGQGYELVGVFFSNSPHGWSVVSFELLLLELMCFARLATYITPTLQRWIARNDNGAVNVGIRWLYRSTSFQMGT